MLPESPRDPVWQALVAQLCKLAPEDAAVRLRLLACDRDQADRFARGAGVNRACAMLLKAHFGKKECPAILLLGLFDRDSLASAIEEPALKALLHWPGIEVLCYGIDAAGFRQAVDRVLAGCGTPLPSEMLPTRSELLARVASLRHWLEGRLNNTNGALRAVQLALQGSTLHEAYLQPVEALTKAHRDEFDSLFVLESAVLEFAPTVGGVEPVRRRLADFEERWQALELVRAEVHVNPWRSGEPLTGFADAYVAARQAQLDTLAEIDRLHDALDE